MTEKEMKDLSPAALGNFCYDDPRMADAFSEMFARIFEIKPTLTVYNHPNQAGPCAFVSISKMVDTNVTDAMRNFIMGFGAATLAVYKISQKAPL